MGSLDSFKMESPDIKPSEIKQETPVKLDQPGSGHCEPDYLNVRASDPSAHCYTRLVCLKRMLSL